MSADEFTTLYNLVAARDDGWEEALVAAWGCLTDDQKKLLATV